MFGKVFKIFLIFLLVFFTIVLARIAFYLYNQHKNFSETEYCSNSEEKIYDNISTQKETLYSPAQSTVYNPDSCFCKMYNLLLPELLVYKVQSEGKDLQFIRFSWDSYIIPTVVMEKADAFISYGTAYNILFEDNLSKFYKKNIYAFDCGVDSISDLTDNPYVFFESECIGTDKYILTEQGQVSSEKIHTLGQKLKQLKLDNKKIYLKMDIAGAEIEVIPDIVKYADSITGISIVIRLDETKRIVKFRELLKLFEKDFILVSRNGIRGESYSKCNCKYMKNEISNAIALTYINKNLVSSKYLPIKQDYHQNDKFTTIYGVFPSLPAFTTDWVVVVTEKIKSFIGRKYE